MTNIKNILLLLALLALLPSIAFGGGKDKNNITFKLGTLGIGADYLYGFTSNSNIRININGFKYTGFIKETDVSFDAKLSLKSAGIIYDFHPFSSIVRFSVGAYYNGNFFSITAKPNSATYIFNDNNYNQQDVGSIEGGIEFKKFSPYFGIGIGSKPHGRGIFGTGLALSLDLGVLYTEYQAALANNNCVSELPNICADLSRDVEVERIKLQNALNDVKLYLITSLGLSYKF